MFERVKGSETLELLELRFDGGSGRSQIALGKGKLEMQTVNLHRTFARLWVCSVMDSYC